VRTTLPSKPGSSVASFDDKVLLERNELFLFAGTDQVLLSFRVGGELSPQTFVHTDKFGLLQSEYKLSEFDRVIVDYTAMLRNWFNFDIRVARRVEIKRATLEGIFLTIRANPIERRFVPDLIRKAS
jgi:hypothetical protein